MMKRDPMTSIRHTLHRGLLLILWTAVIVLFATNALPVSATSGCPEGRRCLFVPTVQGGTEILHTATTTDISIETVEANQAIQNEQNSIPLVAGRGTILRIFSRVTGSNQALTGVRVLITATRDGAVLPGAPAMVATNVPLTVSRNDIQSSLNYRLPAEWLSGTVDLAIQVDPENHVGEADESNNLVHLRLVFNNVPTLQIKIVPIQYAHQGTDPRVYPAPSVDTVSDWVMRTYPVHQVSVDWHAPYTFSGNLSASADFNRLLSEITALKSSESAPGAVVYYALVPTSDGGTSWFHGGIAGIGWIGSRVSVGLDMGGSASQIAAHEIGHNLGLGHTPCGVSGSEAGFPYNDGTIGQYGIDITNGMLYTPTNKDVMSYCNPKWVSDYTYKVLYNAQVKYGAATQNEELPAPQRVGEPGTNRSMMLRATIRGEQVEMQPAYFLPNLSADAPAQGEYIAQLLGADGAVLAEYLVAAAEIVVEGEEGLQGIHVVLPAPDVKVKTVRLLKAGHVLAEQAVGAPPAPAGGMAARARVVTSANGSFALRWDAPKTPALVRYSGDGGTTWTTLGVDVTGGRLDLPRGVISPQEGQFQVLLANSWE